MLAAGSFWDATVELEDPLPLSPDPITTRQEKSHEATYS